MIRRLATIALVVLAVTACQSTALDEDQTPRSRYAGTEGEFPVGVIPEASLRDTARAKDVALSIDYPNRAGSYPLIVFSHGLGSSERAYVGLSSFWASQGYVVIRTGHADAGRMDNVTSGESAWQTQTATEWRNRARDISFVLDSLDQLEQKYPELAGKIDRAKIGVGGHGYGAFTAMLLGGARTYPGATSYADPRVKAVLALSPFGPGDRRGLTNDSFAELKTPALFMIGSQETGVTDAETPEWRRQAYELSPAGDKWVMVVDGARTSTFTGRYESLPAQPVRVSDPPPSTAPPQPQPTYPQPAEKRVSRESSPGLRERSLFNRIQGVSLAFWDTYLRGDAEGRKSLEAAATAKK